MKVKDLTTPTIIKRINLVLFPILAAIFILAGVFIYQLRSQQAMKLGKLQARITSLNMLEFVKNEMLNYINACASYTSMIEMYNEIEPNQQLSYLSQLTEHVLQTNPNVLALRCYFDENGQIATNTSASRPTEIIQSNANSEVAADIERQFYKLGLIDKTSLAKNNHVCITAPYSVQTTNSQAQNTTYNLLTFYRAIRDTNNDIIGQACVDVEAPKIAQLLRQLQAFAKAQNCEVSLYLNEDKKFIGLMQQPATSTQNNNAANDAIDLNSQPGNISEELITIINDGYDAEYDDTRNSLYFFIIPTHLPNFASDLTIIASFSHGELTKSINDFTVKLFIIMAVTYILIVTLLHYINKYLYKKFNEADIIITSSE